MFKKIIYIFTLLSVLVITSCDKLPMNGDLDGIWQLMEIQEGNQVTDVKSKHIYCSFQLHLFSLGSDDVGPRTYFGYFKHENEQMRFYEFTHRATYVEGESGTYDKFFTEDELYILKEWGFYALDCTYDVVELSGSTMVLKHDDTILRYRKF